MSTATNGGISRTTPVVTLAPDQFVIDHTAFGKGLDVPFSMSEANEYFGGSRQSNDISTRYADTGVRVGDLLFTLPTFKSGTRRKTTREACRWLQRIIDGADDAAPASNTQADLTRVRTLVGAPSEPGSAA